MDETGFTAPGFYVVGAAKSGTTAVWSWLRQHPEVYLPDVKEPGFFAYDGQSAAPKAGPYDPDYVRQITTTYEDYARLYAGAGDKVTGDVSPVYLIDTAAAEAIAAARPDARIIILLRDPVTRAFSQFLHNRRDGLEPCKDFAQALAQEARREQQGWSWGHRYRGNGEYVGQIARYLATFDRAQILLWTYEDLNARPEECWAAICQHLGVTALPLPENKRVNETSTLGGVPAHQRLTRHIRHPGPVQKALKALVPQWVRTKIRRRIESAQTPMPDLSPDILVDLINHYALERKALQAYTGMLFTSWSE